MDPEPGRDGAEFRRELIWEKAWGGDRVEGAMTSGHQSVFRIRYECIVYAISQGRVLSAIYFV